MQILERQDGLTNEAHSGNMEERVLILAPVGRDGPLLAATLESAGIAAHLCLDPESVASQIGIGAAAVLVTTESLSEPGIQRFSARLREQPAWSDLPVILLTREEEQRSQVDILLALGNVTILERPLRVSTLVSAVRSALRARRRQYQVRELLRQTDSARREAEHQQREIAALNERLRRAMRETHHRVKNNLQIIAAMVDMQISDGKPAVPVAEIARLGRSVRTLAAIHDLLTQQAGDDTQAASISAADMLDRLLPLIRDTAPGRLLLLERDDVRLSSRQGTSLALVLNELVSNALKHGCGEVSIRFRVSRVKAELEVCDDGPGFPAGFEPSTAGRTGLELVENLSRWDLGGRVRYENHPQGGACVTVTMPLQG